MPSIPNLPTDNFYKFSFLGGLTIVIFNSLLFFTLWNSIREKSNSIELEIANIISEDCLLHEDLVQLEKETTYLESEIGNIKHPKRDYKQYVLDLRENLNDKNYRDYISFISEHEDILFPYIAQVDILVEKTEQYKVKKNKNILNTNILAVKNKHLAREFNYLCGLIIVVVGLYILGITIILYGRKEWVEYQKIIDGKNKVELSILKLQLSKMESDELNQSINPS